MSNLGIKRQEWSKELDNKLLTEISKGKRFTSLSISMCMSVTTIQRRLKEMGFSGIKDAKKVMSG